MFAELLTAFRPVWAMPKAEREERLAGWMRSLLEERVSTLCGRVEQFNKIQERIGTQFNENDVGILRSKRIIACTTTGAAKYDHLIRAASPDVILVEEAGEILESHILTALTSSVKQIVMIGDHKQLRLKVNNYALTVEKGEGFDLNRSLLERLIMQGLPYAALRKQHRMAAEISVFPRELTYPELLEGAGTAVRNPIAGLADRYIFLNHSKLEDTDKSIQDRCDNGSVGTKKNQFEANMVLQNVRYLAQQGYSSEEMVVLTPYLGQLCLLRDILKHDMDPVLNDLDKFELIRAGLLNRAAAKLDKKPLRISTIGVSPSSPRSSCLGGGDPILTMPT